MNNKGEEKKKTIYIGHPFFFFLQTLIQYQILIFPSPRGRRILKCTSSRTERKFYSKAAFE